MNFISVNKIRNLEKGLIQLLVDYLSVLLQEDESFNSLFTFSDDF